MSNEQLAWFDKVVSMRDVKAGVIHNVSNAYEAADILIHRWPTEPGKSHRAAREAVFQAMMDHENRETIKAAETAFADAVREAGFAG